MDRILKDNRYHLFDAHNPVIGTGLVMGAETAFNVLMAVLSHFNPANSKMHHVPTSLILRVTGAGVATTGLELAMVLDPLDRHSAGGTQLTAVDRKVGAPRASVAEIHAGALTLVAQGASGKRFTQRILKAAALAVDDEFQLDFDEERGGIDFGKVAIRPGDNLVLHAWAPAQTTPPEFEIDYRWREVQERF